MVPVYYVLFTLSSIVGGIVLYKEFHQHCPAAAPDCHYTLLFLLGVAVTFSGVYLIAFNRPDQPAPADADADRRLVLSAVETEGLLTPARPGLADSPGLGYDSDVPLSPVSLGEPSRSMLTRPNTSTTATASRLTAWPPSPWATGTSASSQ